LVTVSLFDCCTLVHTVTQLLWRQRPRCAGYDALLSFHELKVQSRENELHG